MLAGLQSEVESLFPKLRTLVPDEETVVAGEQKVKYGRIIKISGYKTEIFDMHDEKSRRAYAKRMLDLSTRAQTGLVNILQHDRTIMTRKDGSTGWFSYLEWMEYSRTGEGTKKED